MIIFAHAGEVHETSTETAKHLVLSPYLSVPIFLVIIIGLYFGLKKLGIKTAVIMNIMLGLFLIIGLFGYALMPIVGILAISFGITLALFIVLSSIT